MTTAAHSTAKRSLPLADVAHRLGVRYQAAYDLLMTGKLTGARDSSGRWTVDLKSVERVEREMVRPTEAVA